MDRRTRLNENCGHFIQLHQLPQGAARRRKSCLCFEPARLKPCGHQKCRHLVGDREGTFAIASRLNTLAERFGLVPWRGGGRLLLAWATANGSGIADAARVVDAEMEKATATGPIPQYYMGLAAEILLAAGRSADRIVYLDSAIAAIDEPGIGFYLPEIYRLRGECLLALDHANVDEAKRAFAAACDIANRQGAVIFERRAEASLCEIAIGTSR
jgi:predicted ATPase